MSISNFQSIILQGIPGSLPAPKPYDPAISHAPRRNIGGVLTESEKKLAGSGFQNIRVEDIGWRVIPTAMHPIRGVAAAVERQLAAE